jgi:hypothetical protein
MSSNVKVREESLPVIMFLRVCRRFEIKRIVSQCNIKILILLYFPAEAYSLNYKLHTENFTSARFFSCFDLLRECSAYVGIIHDYEKTNVKKKVNSINSSQSEGLSLSCIALSSDGCGSILWVFSSSFTVFTIFCRISNFFRLNTTEVT